MSALAIKAILAAVGISAILAAGGWFIHSQRQAGRDAAVAEMTTASTEETMRRQKVVAEHRKVAEAAANQLQIVEATNAELRQQIDVLSARNDSVDCLDRDAVDRLRKLDEPGR